MCVPVLVGTLLIAVASYEAYILNSVLASAHELIFTCALVAFDGYTFIWYIHDNGM